MLNRMLLLSIFFCSFQTYSFSQASKDIRSIKAMLDRQSEKWNNFDIDGFMDDYWNSDQLVFVNAGGPIYGWQSTLDRYNRTYPDQASMGRLKFDILNVDKQSRKIATVIGKFHLTRPQVGDLSGYFSLVLKKIKGQWKIIADHTTVEE